jgi:hypothetical protein
LICVLSSAGALTTGCDRDEQTGSRRTNLLVTVSPGAGEAGRTREVRCPATRRPEASAVCKKLSRVTSEQLRPVPRDRLCTANTLGPARARLNGVLYGERVDASFRLTNGCEIGRWQRLAFLLGDPRMIGRTP